MSRSDRDYRAHDRIGARYLALCLGLRIGTICTPWGGRTYFLWPDDGFAWEMADPPISQTWAGMYRIMNLIARSAML